MKKDYFTAYNETLDSVSEATRSIADDFLHLGFKVMTNIPRGSSKRVKGLFLEKDGKHLSFWFTEVPYQWTASAQIKPNVQTGSGYTVKTFPFNRGTRPTVEAILECFRDNYIGQDLNPSYMVKYDKQND